MRLTFILPLLAVAVLIISCFLPWMTVESRALTITGVDTTGTTYRQPGIFHFIWAGAYLAFVFIPKLWARRTTVAMAGFNMAWAIRNFLLLPICQMGECPEREAGLYLLLVASLGMFVTPLFGRYISKSTNG